MEAIQFISHRKTLFFILSLAVFYSCNNSHVQTLSGHIDGLSDQQTLTFQAKAGEKLDAELKAEPQGNIRINQIISPSGEADGPFGQSMEYDINETGEWKLVIGGSLMQGDDYSGDFTVTIRFE